MSYSRSLADVSQTFSLEKQKANTFFSPHLFFPFLPQDFYCIFFFLLPSPSSLFSLHIFHHCEQLQYFSRGTECGGRRWERETCPRTVWKDLEFRYQRSVSSKPALRPACRTGTRPLRRRAVHSLNTCAIHLPTSSCNMFKRHIVITHPCTTGFIPLSA